MLVTDEQGRVILANDAACRMFGHGRDALIGRTERFDVRDAALVNALSAISLQAGLPWPAVVVLMLVIALANILWSGHLTLISPFSFGAPRPLTRRSLPFSEPAGTLSATGPSGVGKSTLANRLLGEDRFDTREVREADRKGRLSSSPTASAIAR